MITVCRPAVLGRRFFCSGGATGARGFGGGVRGRGARGFGGIRGRGSRGSRRPTNINRSALDSELDNYMAQANHMDNELLSS